MTDGEIIEKVLKYEGGFVNHPDDRGGATNFGITAADLGRWRCLDKPATPDQVRDMTVDEAKQIYQAWYIDKPGFSAISDGYLKWVVVDSGVLHGTKTAAKWLQAALAVTVDGVIGGQTTTALRSADAAAIARKMLGARVRRYGGIVSKNRTQVVFLEGWLNRVTSLFEQG